MEWLFFFLWLSSIGKDREPDPPKPVRWVQPTLGLNAPLAPSGPRPAASLTLAVSVLTCLVVLLGSLGIPLPFNSEVLTGTLMAVAMMAISHEMILRWFE